MIADVATERAVIGTVVMLGNESFARARRVLDPDHFADAGCAAIWRACDRAVRLGHLDTLALRAHLPADFPEEAVLAATSAIPDSRMLDERCNHLRELAVARAVAKVGAELYAAGQSNHDGIREYLDTAAAKLAEALRGRVARVPGRSIGDACMDLYDHMGEMVAHRGIIGHKTGLTGLDNVIHGLMNGKFYVIAGRPGMGKSAMALRTCSTIARSGMPVIVFSLEAPSTEWAARMLAADSMLLLDDVITGEALNKHPAILTATLQQLSELPIHIVDTTMLDYVSMCSAARSYAVESKGKVGAIVVDYLQLMRGLGREQNREREIAEISRSCKALAMELDCPVVALSQLNREVERRPNKRPMLSDLRESGSIEQDADVVLFMYRDEHYNPDTEAKGIAEIIVAKNRSGRCARVECAWIAERCSFENLSRDQPGRWGDHQ